MLSSRNFVVSGATFKSLILFELIFVSGVSQGSSLILLHMNIKCKCFFSTEYSWLPCQILVGHILDLLISSPISLSFFFGIFDSVKDLYLFQFYFPVGCCYFEFVYLLQYHELTKVILLIQFIDLVLPWLYVIRLFPTLAAHQNSLAVLKK